MATLAPMNPPRQPFGVISGSRLRNLGNAKNKQNALPSSQPSNLKTFSPQPQLFNDIDSENIDPCSFISSDKSSLYSKGLQSTADNMNYLKAPQFALSRAGTFRPPLGALRAASQVSQAIGTKRKAESVPAPSDAEPERPVKSPRNVLPPAGRSPKSKRLGILSRRRTSTSSFARVDPPTFGKKGHAVPFSLDAALAGTLSSSKSRKPAKSKEYSADTVLGSMPHGWEFDIHVDSKDEEASNLMEHSACTLDISDDESLWSKLPSDDDNKENVPPHPGMNANGSRFFAPVFASRKHMMTDEPRCALGELNPTEFYADGCDANSYFCVPQEELGKSDIKNEVITGASHSYVTIPVGENNKSITKNEVITEASTAFAAPKVKLESIDENITWNDLVEMAKPTNNSTGVTPAMKVMTTSAPVLEQDPVLVTPVAAANTEGSVTIREEDEVAAAGSVL